MTPAQRMRLVGILSRLASDFDGERAAAGLLATRMLKSVGLTWEQLLAIQPATASLPPPSTGWPSDLALCRRHVSLLRTWEQGFIASVASRLSLSLKQRVTLHDIAESLRARGKA